MVRTLTILFIPGVMFGVEWDYENGFFVIDLGIIRLAYDYRGFDPDEYEKDQEKQS